MHEVRNALLKPPLSLFLIFVLTSHCITFQFPLGSLLPPPGSCPAPSLLPPFTAAMQSVSNCRPPGDSGVRLELTPTTTSPLAIDVAESTEMRIRRLVAENPLIIFSRSSCFMCHVMKNLLANLGVYPTVIELDEDEIASLSPRPNSDYSSREASSAVDSGAPALYIGGAYVGGFDSLVALHLTNNLVPKLVEVGALSLGNEFSVS